MTEMNRQVEALEVFLERSDVLDAFGGGNAWLLRAVEGPYLRRIEKQFKLKISQSDRRLAGPFLFRDEDPLASLPDPRSVSLAIVFATKHREEVLFDIACAIECLEEGGLLIVTVANDLGADSLERRIQEALGSAVPFSKHKCRVIHAIKQNLLLNGTLLDSWKSQGQLRPLGGTGLWSGPGMFSWKSPDRGSVLLAEFLPEDLEGRGADLGAGYGFLTQALISKNALIEEITLLEIEEKALRAAKLGNFQNPKAVGDLKLHFVWGDVTAGTGLKDLDFVVTNPPFHRERGATPALGQRFLREALAALRPGGRLFLVANRHLPYEEVLFEAGAEEIRAEVQEGFKLLEVCRSAHRAKRP